MHRVELRLALLAMLALLIAQFGAVAHSYAHHDSAHHPGTTAHSACDDCLAYAPVLSGAGAPEAQLPIGRQTRATAWRPAVHSLVARAPSLAFRSRAPPRGA